MFAIKSLATLLSQVPEKVLSNGNGNADGLANKNENENKDITMMESAVGETEMSSETAKIFSDGDKEGGRDDDDDSTAAISESSSSSHILTTFGTLTEAASSPPLTNGNNNNHDSMLFSASSDTQKIVAEPAFESDDAKDEETLAARTGAGVCKASKDEGFAEESVGNQLPIATETEATKDEKVECTDTNANANAEAEYPTDGNAKYEQAADIASAARAEAEAEAQMETEEKAASVLANESNAVNAKTESDAEAARDAMWKSEKDGEQISETVADVTTTINAGDKNDLLLKAEEESRAETNEEETRPKVTEEGIVAAKAETEATAGGTKPEGEDQCKGGDGTMLAAEEEATRSVELEAVSLKETKNEVVPKTIATTHIGREENKKERVENTPVVISTTVKESETPSLTLAQRMKEMFESTSPDQPSNAFGKNTRRSSVSSLLASEVKGDGAIDSPKPVCRAKDLKKMFDSPSPDAPSRAFGVGKGIVPKPEQPAITVAKLQCDTDIRMKEPNVETTKPASPVSVADQMVSLLWASSAPTKKSLLSSIDPENQASTKQEVDDNIAQEANHTVFRETVIEEEYEDIEEITVDEGDDDAIIRGNGDDDELIEEVTIEDEHRDDMSLMTADEFFESTARIEVSPNFVDTIEKENNDERSYDEITDDDWEYDEKTVDDDDGLHIESKERVEEKEDGANTEANVETIATIKNTSYGNADYPGNVLPESLHPSRTAAKKKLDFETKRSVDPEHNDKKSLATISPIPLAAPANVTQTTLTPTKPQDNHRLDSPKSQKLNPRLLRDQSATGTLAEKLKMFDSQKAVSGQKQAITFKQSWRKPIYLIESSRDEPNKETKKDKVCNQKTPVALPVVEQRPKQVDRLDARPSNPSESFEEDKALVEEIVSLVKEPGAMKNKHVLVERITSLLTGKSREGAKASTPHCSLYLAPSKSVEGLSPKKSKDTVESNSYSTRKKDGFQDPGLKQMRKAVKVQKGRLYHVDDPDTIPKRHMKRINIKERKAEAAKAASTKPPSDEIQKVVNAAEIIARIWPKTPDGGKRKPKASSSSSRSPKNVTFESPRTNPSKLGDRLKMFEAPPSSSISPPKNPGTFEKDESFIETPKTSTSRTTSTKVALENENASGDARNSQISKKTVRRILSFQRLWRTRKLKRCTTTTTHRRDTAPMDVAPPRKKEVAISKTKAFFPASPKGKTNNDPGVSIQSIPVLSDPTTFPLPASASGPASQARAPSTTRSSCGSDDGCDYSLEDLEQGRFDQSVVDMERWEGFLSDENFYKHFGLAKDDFYQQPKWKREKQKRKVRVAF